MEDTALTVAEQTPGEVAVRRDPDVVLQEAQRAAAALKKVLDAKPVKVMFGEGDRREQYLEFEDWQTVGKFYGITAKVTGTRFVTYDLGNRQVSGFEATADAIVAATGAVISAGEAMCLNDEDKWSTRSKYEWRDVIDPATGGKIWDAGAFKGKGGYRREKEKVSDDPVPLYQLRSMAQTRSCAKALRNCLSWVVVLAGYKPTPVEEIAGTEHSLIGDDDPPEHVDSGRRQAPRQANSNPAMISPAQGGRLVTIAGKNGYTRSEVLSVLADRYKLAEIDSIPKAKYDEIVKLFEQPKQMDEPPARPRPGGAF